MGIVGNHQMLIANAKLPHHFGERLWRSNLRFDRVLQVNNIACPVDIHCSRYVCLLVLVTRADIPDILNAISLGSAHVAAHINDAYIWIVQVFG